MEMKLKRIRFRVLFIKASGKEELRQIAASPAFELVAEN